MQKQRKRWPIPEDILIPAASKAQRRTGHTIENMVTYDIECIKRECGPHYAHVPLDDIRRQATNLRKRSRLGAINGHGPKKAAKLTEAYKTYMQSEQWKVYRLRIAEHWGWRCAMCYSKDANEVHHRTYARLGGEQLTDCIFVCHNCHKAADQRRQRQEGRNDDPGLFE